MTTTKPRPRPQRSINVVETAGDWFLVEINQQFPRSARADYYLAREIRADWGRGFELEKEDATVYHVNIGELDSCDCRGFVNHRHCKHASGIRALIAAGKVPKPGPVTVPFPAPKPKPARPAARVENLEIEL